MSEMLGRNKCEEEQSKKKCFDAYNFLNDTSLFFHHIDKFNKSDASVTICICCMKHFGDRVSIIETSCFG